MAYEDGNKCPKRNPQILRIKVASTFIVRISDFLNPAENEINAVERAIRQIQDDPIIHQAVPVDLRPLPFEGKKRLRSFTSSSRIRTTLD